MPAAISAALIQRRGADRLSLDQLHDLGQNEDKFLDILRQLGEAAGAANEAKRMAEDARTTLGRETTAANAALQAREDRLKADTDALDEDRAAAVIANEAATRALTETGRLIDERSEEIAGQIEALGAKRQDLERAERDADEAADARKQELAEQTAGLDEKKAQLDNLSAEIDAGAEANAAEKTRLDKRDETVRAAMAGDGQP